MPFDFKKEYKEFYLPKSAPGVIDVPEMSYVAVRGRGDPNAEGGEYKRSIEVLYSVAFTIKMSKMGDHRIEGYFDYVVPPLEGFWRQGGVSGAIDYSRKDELEFISCIRLPDFVTREEFVWAVGEAARKKKADVSRAEFLTLREGLCVQCMHIGPYDAEPATVALMDEYAQAWGLAADFSDTRLHHEIYLSDPRRCAPEKLRTVVRHPVRPVGGDVK